MARHNWFWVLLGILVLSFQPRFASSQAFVCLATDSVAADTVASHFEAVYAKFHVFGADSSYSTEFDVNDDDDFTSFRQVFTLYLSDHVSRRFSTPEWKFILHSIMDNDDETTRNDVFGKVWDYFLRPEVDSDPEYAGVHFHVGTATYTRIFIFLYDTADDVGMTQSTISGSTLFINASSDESVTFILGVIGHELQHVCYWANGSPGGYAGIDESLSTAAEYFLNMWRPVNFNLPYDSSIMDYEPCDIPKKDFLQPQPKYHVYKAWMIYLYESSRGNPSDPTDDLLYRWIRNNSAAEHRLRLNTFADLLWSDTDYEWLGGSNATERLNRLYANFVAAKFCNAPDFAAHGEMGSASVSTVTDLGFFTDNDATPTEGQTPDSPIDCPPYEYSINNAAWNVRVLTPKYVLGDDEENSLTMKAGLYSDVDNSVDSIDVYMYGTDYEEFRAGSYFQDEEEHELRIEIDGRGKASDATMAIQPVGWIMGYSESDDTLQLHPEHLVFVEPISFDAAAISGGSVSARTITVTDFGRSIKAVVLAIGAGTLRPDLWDEPINGLTYEYAYGVYTPGASSRTWEGDVYAVGDVSVKSGGELNVSAGTHVNIFGTDLAGTGGAVDKIEFDVAGELVADGTVADPIIFEPWAGAAAGDWVGFAFDSTGSGAFDHCLIRKAETAVQTYAPLTMTNTEIDSCSIAGVISGNGDLLVQNCQFTQPGYFGISVAADDAVIRNTKVDGALGYGLLTYAGLYPSLDVHGSWFMNCDTGLSVSGNVPVDIDSACFFYQNDTGIHFYNAGTTSTVRSAGITWNASGGILCDVSSSPRIVSNIFAHNGGAIYCSNSSSPRIQLNQIQSAGNAITATSSAYPNIGYGSSAGSNQIAHASKYVANYNGGTIYARHNGWDLTTSPCSPASSKFIGTVAYDSTTCPCSFPTFTHNEGEPDFGESLVFQLPQPPVTPKRTMTTSLLGIVPNPFNPQTTIQYSLASRGRVEIKIYDVAGRLVETLASETQIAGHHSVVWKGIDRRGSSVASGIYFVRLNAAGQVFTRKMVLLK